MGSCLRWKKSVEPAAEQPQQRVAGLDGDERELAPGPDAEIGELQRGHVQARDHERGGCEPTARELRDDHDLGQLLSQGGDGEEEEDDHAPGSERSGPRTATQPRSAEAPRRHGPPG